MSTARSSVSKTPEETSRLQTILRWLLGAFLLFAGVSHLTFARTEFRAQVPNFVPLPVDLVVVLSGLVEITLGASLIALKRYRTMVGGVVAAFFVAVFPGNISQYLNHRAAFGLNSDQARLLRLLGQPGAGSLGGVGDRSMAFVAHWPSLKRSMKVPTSRNPNGN